MSDEQHTFTVWSTKYALTKGILRHDDAILCGSPEMVEVRRYNYLHGEGRDWHRTPESAIARAKSMAVAKIASHKKSIARLEKMTFDAI